MKRFSISDVQPGMIVGRPIFSNHGQLILEEGTVLTEKLIAHLHFYGIYNVMIQEPQEEELPTSNPVEETADSQHVNHIESTQSRSLKIKMTPEFQRFQIDYMKETNLFQNEMKDILTDTSKTIDTNQLLTELNSIVTSSTSTMDLFDLLHNMRQIDDSIYAHSLNVALISKTLGKWLQLSESDLQILTLCGLLHDVGKMALPKELINKPGRYTDSEFEKVKRHPLLGYQLLSKQPIDERIKNAALMHHERCDGTGYPQRLTQTALDDFAMIVAIADVYDAMTAARSYRKPLCPFQVISVFEMEGLQKYHPKYILTFLERIADTYQHNRVLLSNGQSGTIVMINKQHLTQPYIQMDDGSILDMTTCPEVEIVSIL